MSVDCILYILQIRVTKPHLAAPRRPSDFARVPPTSMLKYRQIDFATQHWRHCRYACMLSSPDMLGDNIIAVCTAGSSKRAFGCAICSQLPTQPRLAPSPETCTCHGLMLQASMDTTATRKFGDQPAATVSLSQRLHQHASTAPASTAIHTASHVPVAAIANSLAAGFGEQTRQSGGTQQPAATSKRLPGLRAPRLA